MLESTFSPLTPTENSEEFYRQFYYQYSLIQVNSVLWLYMKTRLNADDENNILEFLNGYHDDHHDEAIFALAMGVMNPALMRRRKENRSICTDFYKQLEEMQIDPLDWYANVIEFLMVYAVCEQAIKDFLVSQNVDSRSIIEDSMINKLFDILSAHKLREKFLKELSAATNQVISSQSELFVAWRYFTLFRHGFVHTGGRPTDRLNSKMKDCQHKNKAQFERMNSAISFECTSENGCFFFNPFGNSILLLPDEHLNFFRNMALLVVESIERAIHPEEYQIPDFDPYRL